MDLGDLVPVAIAFVVVGIVLAFGMNILGDVRTDFVPNTGGCNSTTRVGCGADYNATTDSMAANTNVAEKLPLLGLVIAAAIIIGVLLKAFKQ